MNDTSIQKSIFIAADQKTVWDYLTKADLLGKWFHPAKSDLRAGESFSLHSKKDDDRMCWGTVIAENPHTYMKWDFTVGPLNGQMTTVEWHLKPAAGGTRLSLEHNGLPDNIAGFGLVLALDKGWHGFLAAFQSIKA